MARLILLDRDGVVNFDSPDYIKSAAEWEPIPGSLEAIAALRNGGYLVAVCTNQAGIGRGLFTVADLTAIHQKMRDALERVEGDIDGLRFCPHVPEDRCRCRKPEPGMLSDSMAALKVAPAETIMVGDSLKDVQAAQAAGCRPMLVRTGHGKEAESSATALGAEVFDNLAACARALLPR